MQNCYFYYKVKIILRTKKISGLVFVPSLKLLILCFATMKWVFTVAFMIAILATMAVVSAVDMLPEAEARKKASGTYTQKFGLATKAIVCGDRLCSEVGADNTPNVSATGKHMNQESHDAMRAHDDSMKKEQRGDMSKKHHGTTSSETITGAVLKSNNFDRNAGVVTVVIDSFDDGKIKIDVPHFNEIDMVIVDGEEWDDAYVHGKTVKVYFHAGAEKIEIIGNVLG